MSDESLKQLLDVMSSLIHKADLAGKRGPLKIGNAPKRVNNDEQHAILSRLYTEGLGSFSNDGKSFYLYENMYANKSFYDFYNLAHEEYHKRTGKTKNIAPHYDQTNRDLYIQNFKIRIVKHDEDTKQHQLLKYIFITNLKDIGREFDFTEFPFDDVGDKKKFKEICRTACVAINRKIAKETKNEISDFLEFNTRTYGFLKINPKYLPK